MSFIWTSVVLILLSTPSFAAGQQAKDSVLCRSKDVMDAGYRVRVAPENQTTIGYVCSVTFAGEGHVYFDGPLRLRKTSPVARNECSFVLSDQNVGTQESLRILISTNGSGRIQKLEGNTLPQDHDSFTELTCIFDPEFLKQMNCL